MSYLPLIKTLPTQFSQPTVIAALISLGIHGVLALTLPKISTASKLDAEKMHGTVKVVQLTPAEQNRLPQTAPIPPLAYQTQPLSPEQMLPYTPQPLPPVNSSPNIPQIRLPPATRLESPPNNSRLNQRSLGSRSQNGTPRSQTEMARRYRLYGEPIFKGRKFSVAQGQPSTANKPQIDSRRRPSRSSENLPVLTPRTFDPPAEGDLYTQLPPPESPDNSAQTTEDTNPQRPTTENPDTSAQKTDDPKPQRPPTDKPDIPSQSAEDLKPQRPTTQNSDTSAQRTEVSQPQSPTSENPNSSPQTPSNSQPPRPSDDKISQQTPQLNQRQQQLLADIQQQRRSLTRNDANTSNEDAKRNYVAWSVKRDQVEKEPEEITLSGSYPKNACIKKLEGTPVVAVLVDDKNNVKNKDLMRSSGYPIFDEKALEDAVKLGSFNNKTSKPKTYLVSVKYEYNRKICPSLSVPETPAAG